MTSELPGLKSFLLSGGNTIVSYCHIARTICRRAERLVIQLDEKYKTSPLVLTYLKQTFPIICLFFSRKIGKDNNVKELLWNHVVNGIITFYFLFGLDQKKITFAKNFYTMYWTFRASIKT